MSNCLGIYIHKNLIKYAKVSRDHNELKIEAYGVKFYDDNDIEKTVEQIVKETNSFQTPISINIAKEKYAYANVFAMLKQNDLRKAIDTEFEFFCNNNNQNKNTVEYRESHVPNIEDKDKMRVIYTYVDKSNLVEKLQFLDKYNIQNVSPIATTIPFLSNSIFQEQCMIVNIEENTEITTIANGAIYSIDKIEQGMDKILKTIYERENSIQKAYEICKNTTVYTQTGANLRLEGNEYLDEIIIALVEIIDKVKEVIIRNGIEVNNIYISGMGLIINNIDLLFQESFIDKKCEILVPYFIEKANTKLNIKDYIEVNSAISLALQVLENKSKGINFSNKGATVKNIIALFSNGIGQKRSLKLNTNRTLEGTKNIMTAKLDSIEKKLLRASAYVLIAIVLFTTSTDAISEKIKEKTESINEISKNNDEKIAEIIEYKGMVDAKTAEYNDLVTLIDSQNSKVSENYLSKNAIPNLLNKIMYNIPTGVQLLSIENSVGKNITITAQSEKYDQLGYFKAVLEEEKILTNVESTKGVKSGDLISITIKGQLPY